MTLNDQEFGHLQGTVERLISSIDLLTNNIEDMKDCWLKHTEQASARETKIAHHWWHILALWGVVAILIGVKALHIL